MDEKELQEQINQVMGIDPALIGGDSTKWASIWTTSDDSTTLKFDAPRKNPPIDPLEDLITASLASHYIIDRISRDELVKRLLKVWPDAGGLDLSEFLDKLDREKDAYWLKVRGDKEVGK